MIIARKDDWKTEEMPLVVSELQYERQFSSEEFELIKHGIVPQQMEDKWFIFFENNLLKFFRSWTGHQIYQLQFEKMETGYHVVKTIVNRDSSQYKEADDAYDIEMLNFLMDRLLLNKNVKFPLKATTPKDQQMIFQHGVIGYGRSNQET